MSKRQGRYPVEIRERAVRLVPEHRGEYRSAWTGLNSISAKLGVTREAPKRWMRRAQVHGGCFLMDVYPCRLVGWQASCSLCQDLELAALAMALWALRGQALRGLVHHSDRGVQYLITRSPGRLAEAGALASTGDPYDNALAESFNGPYEVELIRKVVPGLASSSWTTPLRTTSIGPSTGGSNPS